jgi:hypothetical protein
MKKLKFTPELCLLILAGEKTSTWRLFDDKNLQLGDELLCINKDTLESFGTAIITNLTIKTLGTLVEADWEGHERFTSEESMYQTYRSFYGDTVSPETEVKLLRFIFTPTK